MNFNVVNDNPLLVAPRPVRLSHLARSLKIPPPPSDEAENADDPRLPRASPRSSEALEEFLSILRPAIFPPSSPVLRPRRNGAISLPTFSVTYRSKIDAIGKPDPLPEDAERHTPACSPEPIADHLPGNWDIFGAEITSRWHAQVLASPISRMHTRNPFPRHAAHDITLTPIHSSPTMISTPTSPAAVPLPAPSPEEALEVF